MGAKPIPKEVQIEKHSIPEPNSGCFLWFGATIRSGKNLYGVIGKWNNKRKQTENHLAHRVAYELTKGKISRCLQTDHLCRNTLCVNPDHLELVTAKEHHRRTRFRMFGNACERGHEYTKENTRVLRGIRYCRTCRNLYAVDERKRMKQKKVAS